MKDNQLISFSFRLFLMLMFISAGTASFAQVNFNAKLSSSKVGVNQSFTVTYVLSGAKSESFERPPFANFRLTGQSSMTGGGSMQMYVNGKLISGNEGEQSWTFTLVPIAPGTYDISPAKVKVNGEWIESSPLKVTVTTSYQNPSPTQSQKQSQQKPQQGQTQQQNRSGQQQNQDGLKSDDVFIRASSDKKTAWIGEPIIVTYQIFTKVTIPSYGINKIPAFDGFWSENLTDPNSKPQQSEEIINGQRYTTALLRKIILYPQRSGNLTLDPLEVEVIARIVRNKQQQNANDWMDQMFSNFFTNPFGNDPFSTFSGFGSSYEDISTTILSNTITLNIKDLPAKNKTSDFSGQIGKYSMEAWIDKDRILIDDAVSLHIKISGNGNMSLLEAPEVNFPESFDVYDPQTEDNTKINAGGHSGNKKFSYLIIPREPGKFKIPPINFTYFDPSIADYKTLSTDEFNIQIIGQQGSGSLNNNAVLEKDIRYIQLKNNSFRKTNSFFFASPLHFILFSLPFAAFLAFIILFRRRMKLYADEQLLRYKKATKTARKRLKKASRLLSENKYNEFYEETARAIWAYLAHRFSIQQAELSIDKVISQLSDHAVDNEILISLRETLDFCEFIRFAPGASSTTPGDILQKAEHTISNLEQHIQQTSKAKRQSL